jgi:hypothetical protein
VVFIPFLNDGLLNLVNLRDFLMGLLPRGYVSPGRCDGGVAERYKGGTADAEVDQGRGFILSPRKYGRSWCVGADRARPQSAWRCQGWGKLSLEQARGKCLARLPSVLFLLERKRTKKFKRVRTDTVCGSKCPLTNSRLEESIVRKA